MAYVKTTWQNSPSTNTPINATNLNHIEQGIYEAAATADQAESGVEALDPRMDLVEQRLDNLIPEGTPTQGNAELIDIRVGANGITYPDAGSAVRGQVTEIKSALSQLSDTQIYNNDCIDYVNGYWNSEGWHESANYYTTKELIKRSDVISMSITQQTGITVYIYEFDEDGEYLQRDTISSITQWENISSVYVKLGVYKSGGIGKTQFDTVYSFTISTGLNNRIKAIEDSYISKAHDITTNYIDLSKITNGKYVKGNDGTLGNSNEFRATDFIAVIPNSRYIRGNFYQDYWAFYDENKTYVTGGGAEEHIGNPIIVPSGCYFLRVSIQASTDLNTVFLYTERKQPPAYGYCAEKANEIALTTPCDYEGKEVCVFRKMLCIGDSFTEGAFNGKDAQGHSTLISASSSYKYPNQITKQFGIETTNMGYGGITIERWWANHQNDDVSGHDVAVIMLGINDALEYNEWTSGMTSALTNIIEKVQNENNGIKVFVCTPPANGFYDYSRMLWVAEGIRTVVSTLADDDVILLDLILHHNLEKSLGYRCGHPSALGYMRLAKDIGNYISYIIHNNLEDFRFVQFTGTDYYWDENY